MRAVGANAKSQRPSGRAAPPLSSVEPRASIAHAMARATGRLVVVSAPGGYGKTAQVAAWAAVEDRPVAWVDLDAGHDDPRQLYAAIVGAIGAVTDAPLGDIVTERVTRDRYATAVAPALGRAVKNSTVPFIVVFD